MIQNMTEPNIRFSVTSFKENEAFESGKGAVDITENPVVEKTRKTSKTGSVSFANPVVQQSFATDPSSSNEFLSRIMNKTDTEEEICSQYKDEPASDLMMYYPDSDELLTYEIFASGNTSNARESIRLSQEDIEDHKNIYYHSMHPLEYAHRRKHGPSKDDAKGRVSCAMASKRKRRGRAHTWAIREQEEEEEPAGDILSFDGDPRNAVEARSTSEADNFSDDVADSAAVTNQAEKLESKLDADVKFSMGEDDSDATAKVTGSDMHGSTRKMSKHLQAMKQMGLPDRPSSNSLAKRQVPGDKVLIGSQPMHHSEIQLQLEEDDSELPEADQDRAQSHRFDYARPTHKLKRPPSFALPGSVSFVEPIPRLALDHTAHDVFVELDELQTLDGGMGFQWKEKARWIKYEEDMELGGGWGKPHVSTLSFHSLLELRKLLEQGVALFDMQETSLSSIVHRICVALKERGTLREEEAYHMEIALNARHSGPLKRSMSVRRFSSFRKRSTMNSSTFVPLRTSSAVAHPQINGAAPESNGLSPELSVRLNHSHSVPSDAKLDTSFALPTILENDTSEDGDGGGPVKSKHVISVEAQGPQSQSQYSPGGTARKTSVLSTFLQNLQQGEDALTDIEKRIPLGAEIANVWVGSVDFLQAPIMLFVRLAHGVMLNEVSEVRMPMRFIFILMGPVTRHMFVEDYQEIGRAMSTLMSYREFREACYAAKDATDLIAPMNAFLNGSVVVPAHGWDKGNVVRMLEDIRSKMMQVDKQRKLKRERDKLDQDEEDDELRRSDRCFGGGLMRDVKRRYPLYLSDFKDALSFQCVSVTLFIFFSVLSSSITFGADIELERVNSWMGVYEAILGSAVIGSLFALLSGQPLLIVGLTGPLAVFEGSLYDLSEAISEKSYMAFRCWVGLWVGVICAIVSLTEGSILLKYFSRFVEEIFAMLVSLIYCVSVIENLIKIFKDNPLEKSCDASEPTCEQEGEPNTALLSLIMTFGCFIIAYSLKQFRYSSFLATKARKMLGDFGVPIAIFAMTGLDVLLNDKAYTKKMNFPDKFEPTKNGDNSSEFTRGWFISPFDLDGDKWWLSVAAIIPAIFLFFLIFIEIQITGRIMERADYNFKKGTGYHLNILVISLSGIIGGLLGCPFVGGATVRSVGHANALIVTDSHSAPGEKPKQRVMEQRVTSLAVMVCLGLSVLLEPILVKVPYTALYGIFFYMGVVCMTSLQFWTRLKLVFMQRSKYPSLPYARDVRRWKTHLFTLIQILAIGALWGVKESPASIAFPFFIMLLVPFRLFVLPFIFSQAELEALDSEEMDDHAHPENEDGMNMNLTAHMPY